MMQIGNLAVVAANNKECVLTVYDGEVTLFSGIEPERKGYVCSVRDNESIDKLIAFINFKTEIYVDEKIRRIR